MKEIILEVENLQKCYTDFQLININFTLERGSITGFIGQNGAGVKYLIALELSKEPELILFDEPTSGLDPVVRNDILDILKELALKEKITIFFSSHITEDIEKIADNVIYIDNGKIILNEPKCEINKRFVKIHLSEIEELDDKQKKIIIDNGIIKNENYIIDKNLITENLVYRFSPISLAEVLLTMKGAKNWLFPFC